MAAGAGGVAAWEAQAWSVAGINDRAQLAASERVMRERVCDRWRLEGATIGPDVTIEAGVVVGHDVELARGVVLRGETRIGDNVRIDVGTVIDTSVVETGAVIKAYCVVTESRVGPGAQVGPFAHLRPKSDLGANAHIGNFVETKNTKLGEGAKANHLSYLGDGDVGDGANIGAGTIFCNYDGFLKHRTTIGPRAFIGSDSQLVAGYVGGCPLLRQGHDGNARCAGQRASNRAGSPREQRGVRDGPARAARGAQKSSGGEAISRAPLDRHLGRGLGRFGASRKHMSHPHALRLEIRARVRVRPDQHGHAALDVDTEAPQLLDVLRVVRHQRDGFDAELAKNCRRHIVGARVVRQAEQTVRVDGIGTLRLKRIGSDLVRKANAPALLAQVNDDARATPRDLGLRRLELLLAVALERAEHFARNALAMDAHGHAPVASNVAHDERDVLSREAICRLCIVVLKHDGLEGTKSGRKGRAGANDELRPDLLFGDVHLALLVESGGSLRVVRGGACLSCETLKNSYDEILRLVALPRKAASPTCRGSTTPRCTTFVTAARTSWRGASFRAPHGAAFASF
jgi:acetyltransferase-like isoleucine patch superfamily enzyme